MYKFSCICLFIHRSNWLSASRNSFKPPLSIHFNLAFDQAWMMVQGQGLVSSWFGIVVWFSLFHFCISQKLSNFYFALLSVLSGQLSVALPAISESLWIRGFGRVSVSEVERRDPCVCRDERRQTCVIVAEPQADDTRRWAEPLMATRDGG